MKTKLLTLALLAGFAAAPLPLLAAPVLALSAQSVAAAVPDPAAQIEDMARLFRAGDLNGLAQAVVPPSKWEEIKLAYELQRLQPLDEDDRAEFAENIGRFTAPDAVDQLMAQIEPEIEKVRPQVPGALLMGFGAIQMAISSPESELTEAQREALKSAFPGLQRWATERDFLDTATLRQALTLLTDAARRTGVDDLEQIRQLPLESVLDRAGVVFAAAKDAVRLYGIDLDAVADSLRVEVLSVDGDTARVRTTVTLFDAPVWHDHDLVLVDGRWYGKDAIVHFEHDAQANNEG